MSLSRHLKRSLPLLAALAMPSKADVVRVGDQTLDVKRENLVVLTTDNKPVSDPELLKKAIITDMVVEEMGKTFGKLNDAGLNTTLGLLKAHEFFYGKGAKLEGAAEQAAKVLGGYLSGNVTSLSPKDVADGVKYIRGASESETRTLAKHLFSDGVSSFERNVDLYRRMRERKNGAKLTYEEALEFLRNDKIGSMVADAKSAYVEGFVQDFKEGVVSNFTSGVTDVDAEKLENIVRKLDRREPPKVDLKEQQELRGRESDNRFGKALYTRGRTLVDAGRYKESIPILEEAVQLNPNDARTHNCLGAAYAGIKSILIALREAQLANQLDPAYDEPYLNIALCYANLGKHREGVLYAKGYLLVGTDPKRIIEATKYINDFDK